MNEVFLIGSGGHARVLGRLVEAQSVTLTGVVSPDGAGYGRIPNLGGDEVFDQLDPEASVLVNGLGYVPGNYRRRDIFEELTARGFSFLSVAHEGAQVEAEVSLGEGVQILLSATVCGGTYIGDNTIVNTASSVDHDCQIGRHCHVAPGATLCGEVKGAAAGHGGMGFQG